MSAPCVLIIDDEKNLVNSLIYGFKQHGIRAEGALDGRTGLARVDDLEPDVILLDLRLPDRSGIDVLGDIKRQRSDLPVIMISAHGDTRAAVEAVKAGAEDYFTKPFELDELVHLIQRTVERQRLAREVAYRRREKTGELGELLGASVPIAALRQQIATVGRSGARMILLLGESGTGKALVARAIHNGSARAEGPYIEINCASLPENLLEAELFGAEKGAYTGAFEKRVGLAQLADGGTLFLDEIAELPTSLQAKLLHFLDNRKFRPIGATREHTADVRVIAATNRNIEQEVKAGGVRPDLFYRLNVMPITLPRLAQREADVLLLAESFARSCAADEGCHRITFDTDVRQRFLRYPWPGNVRELRNLIERLTILYPRQEIHAEQLPPEFHVAEGASPTGLEEQLAETERETLLRALAEAGGRKGKAAEALGISRHALKRRLQRLGIA